MTGRDRAERRLWRTLEAVHAVVYFAPETRTAYTGLGLRGYWRGYFASRAAALGTPGARLVTALFFGFAPRMVERAVPHVWTVAAPADVLAVRATLARGVLGAHVDAVPLRRLETAADRLDALVAGLDLAGRPLAAAHADVVGPAEPLSRIWRAATVLREYRGDAHVAALVAAGVDGAQSHVWRAAVGGLDPAQREHRGFTEDEWAAAARGLRARGWLAADGRATASGVRARLDVERRTDAAAALPGLDDVALHGLLDVLGPVAASIVGRGAVPYPNATGVPRPDDTAALGSA